ncbi:Zinc knuckle [Popillia japonica]|uniref:Zinc knuckle n=1 Tax=Popillia japonica TaxID=7064 RepID=A0AAW1MFB9_POPJA
MLEVMGDLIQKDNSATHRETTPVVQTGTRPQKTRCYNCNEEGHYASSCTKVKRERGSCYSCGSFSHMKKNCPQAGASTSSRGRPRSTVPEPVVPSRT